MGSASVSVLLPVYNGQTYLKEAIASILDQTYADFELVIVDDGSTDHSGDIIRSFNDHRIRFVAQKNAGLAVALNRAIALSDGRYIARQDQDDVSLPRRLEKQVEFLENRPEIGLVGTWSLIWTDTKKTDRTIKHPTQNWQLQFDLLFDSPFVHSSVMLRRAVLDQVGLYTEDKKRQPPEDYELWSRLARHYRVANIGEILHHYREIAGSMSRDTKKPFMENVIKISAENIALALNKSQREAAISAVAELSHRRPKRKIEATFFDIKRIMEQLVDQASLLPGAREEVLRASAQSVMTILDHRLPRPFPHHLLRGVVYRIRPTLIDQRKAVLI